jgi:hypothetical protein
VTDAASALETFRTLVLADSALERELRGTSDRQSFVALAVACARAHDCPLGPADIEAALDAAAHDWMMRWLVR